LETPYKGWCKYFNTNPGWIHSKWINFIHALDHASIHFIQMNEWQSSTSTLYNIWKQFIHVQINVLSLSCRLMHKPSSWHGHRHHGREAVYI
jgi:hypothetical protein